MRSWKQKVKGEDLSLETRLMNAGMFLASITFSQCKKWPKILYLLQSILIIFSIFCIFRQGYLLNWDTQKDVWDYLLGKDCFNAQLNSTSIVLTQPYFNFQSIQEGLCELWFEEMECESLLTINRRIISYSQNHSKLILLLIKTTIQLCSWNPQCLQVWHWKSIRTVLPCCRLWLQFYTPHSLCSG